jgi:hypothetical protein
MRQGHTGRAAASVVEVQLVALLVGSARRRCHGAGCPSTADNRRAHAGAVRRTRPSQPARCPSDGLGHCGCTPGDHPAHRPPAARAGPRTYRQGVLPDALTSAMCAHPTRQMGADCSTEPVAQTVCGRLGKIGGVGLAVAIVMIGLRRRCLRQRLRRFTCSLRRLWAVATSSLSLLHAVMPRRDIIVSIWQLLIWPTTGSTVWARSL